MTKNLGILALAFAALCTTGCNRDKPEVSTTTTTASEIEPSTQAQAAPKDDYLATVRREQVMLRSRIDDELRALDRQLLTTTLDAKSREALLEKRETLRADASVIDRADERGWDELKAVVEHDLEGQPQM